MNPNPLAHRVALRHLAASGTVDPATAEVVAEVGNRASQAISGALAAATDLEAALMPARAALTEGTSVGEREHALYEVQRAGAQMTAAQERLAAEAQWALRELERIQPGAEVDPASTAKLALEYQRRGDGLVPVGEDEDEGEAADTR